MKKETTKCFCDKCEAEIENNCSQYDYRYILLDKERMYVAHRGFFFEKDEEAIDAIKDIEDGTGYICLEIEKSLNEAECKEGNFYYKSIWAKQ